MLVKVVLIVAVCYLNDVEESVLMVYQKFCVCHFHREVVLRIGALLPLLVGENPSVAGI